MTRIEKKLTMVVSALASSIAVAPGSSIVSMAASMAFTAIWCGVIAPYPRPGRSARPVPAGEAACGQLLVALRLDRYWRWLHLLRRRPRTSLCVWQPEPGAQEPRD
ncbi:MAG: hypothetical protein [Podoviridae sp. ctdb7]|nr:MAG: hypothetical protein [Podoviridae sp. ctdb7]